MEGSQRVLEPGWKPGNAVSGVRFESVPLRLVG